MYPICEKVIRDGLKGVLRNYTNYEGDTEGTWGCEMDRGQEGLMLDVGT